MQKCNNTILQKWIIENHPKCKMYKIISWAKPWNTNNHNHKKLKTYHLCACSLSEESRHPLLNEAGCEPDCLCPSSPLPPAQSPQQLHTHLHMYVREEVRGSIDNAQYTCTYTIQVHHYTLTPSDAHPHTRTCAHTLFCTYYDKSTK